MNIRVVSASAGTGKTWKLTEELWKALADRELRPEGIVAITYTVKAAGELERIDRLDHFKQLRGFAGFIGLQMADQMKAHAFQPAHLRRFSFEFLHVVLAKIAQSEGISIADDSGGKDLGDRQQKNASRVAPRPLGGALNSLPHHRQSICKGLCGRQQASVCHEARTPLACGS